MSDASPPPERAGAVARRWRSWSLGSGPAVARAFQCALALIFLDAFVSLGVQIDVLIGSRGLLPADVFIEGLRRSQFGWSDAPTLFLWHSSDAALRAGILVGTSLSLCALLGVAPRVMFALSTLLYMSYVIVCRSFLTFQWDNLLLECGLLAVFLPADRAAPWVHVLFRLLLFKLYFESGIAKWQSRLGDWHDGTAMLLYYETAPLPAALGWLSHALPEWWHHLESRGALALELVVPFLLFGPRRARLLGVGLLSGFQVLNLLTANYGFFIHLTLALHLFALDDGDVRRVSSAVSRLVAPLSRGLPAALRRPPRPPERPALARLRRAAAPLLFAAVVGASLVEGISAFAPWPGFRRATQPLHALWAPYRVVNNYHLFGHITRDRIEPVFETRVDGGWSEHSLHYKPGPVERRPPYVAPHQPRVDFLLWFYGLSFRRNTPEYVHRLLERMCADPEAVASLFADPLPRVPTAVRISFWRYHFTTPEERARSGAWWTRSRVAELRPMRCAFVAPP